MKWMRNVVIVALTGLLCAAAPTTQISNTRTAECDVIVWSGYDWNPNLLDFKLALIRELAGPAESLLHVKPEALQQYVTIDFVHPNVTAALPQGRLDTPVRLHLAVNLDADAQPAAKEFLAAVVDQLPVMIDEQQNGTAQLGTYQVQCDVVREQLAELTDSIRERQVHLTRDGLGGATPEGVRAAAAKLYEQAEDVRLDMASAKAERQALAHEISELAVQAKEKADDDPIAAQLEEIVKIKEKRAAILKQAATASTAETDAAEADAAEARVQLLERREAVAQAASGDVLGDLRKQLVNVEVNLAQIQARDQVLADASNQILDGSDVADEMQEEQMRAANDAARIAEYEKRISDLQQSSHDYPKPVVKVVPQVGAPASQ
ncbi:MAG TPA: hypothetical protein VL992_15055 [Tepidisphaeraceae bacterium]|nr:hypothetical protein [Tepidisphaeraceae bacterium]